MTAMAATWTATKSVALVFFAWFIGHLLWGAYLALAIHHDAYPGAIGRRGA